MKLIEAIESSRVPAGGRPVHKIFLACGFTPLHLETFLAAHAQQLLPSSKVEIVTGVYGNLRENLETAAKQSECTAVVAVIEWADVDPRLDLRGAGNWNVEQADDIVSTARERLKELAAILGDVAKLKPVVMSAPTLPFPPATFSPPEQLSSLQAELRAAVSELQAKLAFQARMRIINPDELDALSPFGQRIDANLFLLSGCPYRQSHAERLAYIFATSLHRAAPKKGLITDLDNTLWKGIVGDDGAEGVHWHVGQKSQQHAIYQRYLAMLASSGVLVAIASKNDPAIVTSALGREDLLIGKDAIFPVEANWGAKSVSVQKIIATWNIHADAVVFVDDSAMELAEVQEKVPGLTCELFPAGTNHQELLDLLHRLSGYFGKSRVSDEDKLRSASLRSQGHVKQLQLETSPQDFISRLNAKLTIREMTDPNDIRSFELVNKTNQFNLNGHRYSEAEWAKMVSDPDSFLVTVDYEDKFGPLGKIAVVCGSTKDGKVSVNSWVMSCRAFTRNIEHKTLMWLFERFNAPAIEFDYKATDRNGPITSFLSQFSPQLHQPVAIERNTFDAAYRVGQAKDMAHAK